MLYSSGNRKENGNRHADQMFQTTAEAEGKGLDSVKHIYAPSSVIYLWPFPRRYFCCGSSTLHVDMSMLWSSAVGSPD